MKDHMDSELEFHRVTQDGDLENPGTVHVEAARGDEIQPIVLALNGLANKLELVSHNETGLNTDRIRGFLAGYGLGMKRFSALDNAEMRDIRLTLGAEVDAESNYGGMYLPSCDFTAVSRTLEKDNGPEFTEALAVHELTHAEMKPKKYLYFPQSEAQDRSLTQARGGFMLMGRYEHTSGNFFEEGLAELMTQFYIRDALKKPEGFTDYRYPLNIDGIIMPSKLLHNSSKDSYPDWSIATSAFAAYGMSLLIAKDPNIFTNMLDTRKGRDAELFREFAQRIEKLSPGMYAYLRDRIYDRAGFTSGVDNIIQRLYDGDHKLAQRASENVI